MAGTEAETVKERCLLAPFQASVQLPFLYSLGMVLLLGWVPLHQLAVKQIPQTCPQATLLEEDPQLKFPLPRCVKLTIKISQGGLAPVSTFVFPWTGFSI